MGFEIPAVDEALSEETFDVMEFVAGTNTPEDEIKIYTDADAAAKILKFLDSEKESQKVKVDDYSLDSALPDEEEELLSEEELTELHERLKNSELIFKVKGLAPKALEAVENHLKATTDYVEGAENKEYNKALDHKIVADSIVSVTNSKGQVDKHKWTPQQVEDFLPALYPSERAKLYIGVGNINWLGGIFDQAVSADFS